MTETERQDALASLLRGLAAARHLRGLCTRWTQTYDAEIAACGAQAVMELEALLAQQWCLLDVMGRTVQWRDPTR